jgi:hypothetical protein
MSAQDPDAPQLTQTTGGDALWSEPGATWRAETAWSTGGDRAVAALVERGERAGLTLQGTLGTGGMSVVRLAIQESLGREIAVKTLRPDRPLAAGRLRLLREAWVIGQLEHPNIIPIHDIRVDDGAAPQILLKRIEGQPWSQLLTDRELARRAVGDRDPLTWHLGVLVTICNAVEFAHSRGVLHRDIKPANVMLGAFGEVTLLDWGIAVSLAPDPSGRLPTVKPGDAPIGTLAYMAPEMLAGGPLSVRTDVYLLGAVLYELLTGRPPHRGDTAEAIYASIRAPVQPPEGAPAALRDLCAAACALDPGDRPPTAAVFRAGLERFLERRAADASVRRAGEQLETLKAALAEGGSEEDVAGAFAACQFGFGAALQDWPDHAEARAGLDDALGVMARRSLAAGDLEVAAHYIGQIPTPDETLAGAMEQARRAREDADLGLGVRARLALLVGAAGIGVSMPLLLEALTGRSPGYLEFGISTVVLLAVLGAMGWILRAQLMRTRFNRQVFLLFLILPVSKTLIDLGAWLRGWPPEQGHSLALVMMSMMVSTGTFSIERGLWPAAVLCWGLWLLSSLIQTATFPLIALASVAVVLNLHYAWRKQSREPSVSRG